MTSVPAQSLLRFSFSCIINISCREEVEWNGTELYETVQWDGGVEHAGCGGMKWSKVDQSAEQ